MSQPTGLAAKRCTPCSGTAQSLPADDVHRLLREVPDWSLTPGGDRIRRAWHARDFATALAFFNRIGGIADEEDHHPDLHLTDYRCVVVELWTHAVGGLTENDFILAAKIDSLPLELAK
ncbi:4a-hydroxytetrahydrobiopterin dehydratase [Urbifossiella limnaea]|uniref:Putative pterin-4-alpha-carbinolamine dehydratase n=1 Tax=Urbifossiella limnaea TaxID=2528023 RepID=A0A517XR27_9BACT|nr:4a-hydroxytetrahydrobiopterin dehydratase [Urbifossiella limnaea]QDU19967.1 Putative pterin-4-alpha-carbinolamine dehydratase [Urbifossiella limnaea]